MWPRRCPKVVGYRIIEREIAIVHFHNEVVGTFTKW